MYSRKTIGVLAVFNFVYGLSWYSCTHIIYIFVHFCGTDLEEIFNSKFKSHSGFFRETNSEISNFPHTFLNSHTEQIVTNYRQTVTWCLYVLRYITCLFIEFCSEIRVISIVRGVAKSELQLFNKKRFHWFPLLKKVKINPHISFSGGHNLLHKRSVLHFAIVSW